MHTDSIQKALDQTYGLQSHAQLDCFPVHDIVTACEQVSCV